ncbi:MAG: 30S ribosomal protein S1 [Anaerolineaceae bacterium]|nr:30S ribosomal protein S1 [Anaerolineaceae bacterium]
MLPDQTKSNSEPDMPQLDEGWWASVLADENALSSENREQDLQVAVPSSSLMVEWGHVQNLYDRDEIVEMLVHGFNRGGLLVQGEDVQGFVPVSHLIDFPNVITEDDRRMVLSDYVGKTIKVKVIECEPSQEKIVLSERAALAGEGCRKTLFKTLKTGSIVNGTVTNVTDFGVFVDLGGVEGLIHVSELSWGRVQHPGEVLVVGQTVKVLVLQVSEENARIALSLKRLYSNPWETLAETYQIGDVVQATVTAVTRFGAFARLNEGIEGLIHISSITDGLDEGKDLNKIFTTGEEIVVRILHIDVERRRLGLGIMDD